MKARYAVAAALLALVACSSVRPVAIQMGERCYRCRRNITETKIAAQLIDQQGAPFPFRTSKCLASYLKDHPTEKGTPFVTDYTTGHLFAATDAYFVPTEIQPTDGWAREDDYLAFSTKKDADAANTKKAPVVRWTDVIAAAQ